MLHGNMKLKVCLFSLLQFPFDNDGDQQAYYVK